MESSPPASPNQTEKSAYLAATKFKGSVHDFNYMAEQLERLVGAQKILLRDVSHELRSPLARLSVALELAREEAPAAMTEHLQRIEREAGRLNLLIGQLLRLSSMESMNASSRIDEVQSAWADRRVAPRCGIRGPTKELHHSRASF